MGILETMHGEEIIQSQTLDLKVAPVPRVVDIDNQWITFGDIRVGIERYDFYPRVQLARTYRTVPATRTPEGLIGVDIYGSQDGCFLGSAALYVACLTVLYEHRYDRRIHNFLDAFFSGPLQTQTNTTIHWPSPLKGIVYGSSQDPVEQDLVTITHYDSHNHVAYSEQAKAPLLKHRDGFNPHAFFSPHTINNQFVKILTGLESPNSLNTMRSAFASEDYELSLAHCCLPKPHTYVLFGGDQIMPNVDGTDLRGSTFFPMRVIQ